MRRVEALVILLAGIPCQYTLADDRLLVRSGVVRWRIPYVQITDIEPSRSLWSAAAMSLPRVKVSYGGRFIPVSPREREQFIAEPTQQIERAKRRG